MLMRIIYLAGAVAFFLTGSCFAQPEHHDHRNTGMDMAKEMSGTFGQYPANRESSGTSWQPDSTPHTGLHFMAGEWMLMMHGFLNAIYDNQQGKRGDRKTFSSSMFMTMAQKPLAKGTLGLRSMLSLDPAMGKTGYPLLLQTGETADGRTPLIDRQHAHDLFMELAISYSRHLDEESSAFAYFGLPGEPALGPPAFMHRFSGMDAPGVPITHHWLDSTHITYGVATFGYVWKNLKFEGSIFNGREPDEDRWDIETPEFNSTSARVSFNPTPDWAMQASFGYLDSPEQIEPQVDVRRTTVSLIRNQPLKHANWQTTFAWGRNEKVPGRATDSFLIESAVRIKEMHTLFTRFERVEKDELFLEPDPQHGRKFTVHKITIGYVRDWPLGDVLKWGIGGSLDINLIPDELQNAYGHTPLGGMIFMRLKL